MTPRSLDPDVAQRRLADIQLCLERLASLGPVDVERLASDWQLRATVERLITVLVEAAVKLNTHVATATLGRAPEDYRTSFAAAARAGALDTGLADRLAPSTGLRNVLVHGYDEIDLGLLAAGVELALEQYPRYAEELARFAHAHRDRPDDERTKPG